LYQSSLLFLSYNEVTCKYVTCLDVWSHSATEPAKTQEILNTKISKYSHYVLVLWSDHNKIRNIWHV